MEQEMVDSVVQEIYRNLTTTYYYNKTAKLHNSRTKIFYSDKANIIIKCIKLIKENNIKNVSYKIETDEEKNELIIVRFKFNDKSLERKNFSFHLPNIYLNIIKELK